METARRLAGRRLSRGFWIAAASAFATAAAFAATVTYHYEDGQLVGATYSDGATVTYTYDDNGNRTATITTGVQRGTIGFSVSSFSGGEASGQREIQITVVRTGGSYGAATVQYQTANGSATSGADYTPAQGTLSWEHGDSATKSFTVTVLDDAVYEGTETLTVTLTNATGATLGSSSANISIADDDAMPPAGSVQFAASGAFSVTEGSTSVTITVTRTGGSFGAVSVNYATSNGTAAAGSDYTAKSGTLSWANGDTANKTFTVTILDDSTYEGNETFGITLSGVSGATLGSPSTATVTINDNENPPPGTISLSSSSYSVGENGGSVTITATRTGGSFGAASVNYATSNGTAAAGSDYTTKSGTLSWANGDAANKAFTVTILDDSTYEGNETFGVTLSGVSGASLGSPSSATVTINENENPPPGTIRLSASSYSVGENGGSVTITATRTGGSFGAVSVNYATSNGTAVAGSDYTAKSGTLSWANGDTANKTFTVSILNDSTYEPSESFNVSLSNPSGTTLSSPSSATVTITDDDLPTVSISDMNVNVVLQGSATARYQLRSTGDIYASQSSSTVDVGDWLSPKASMGSFEARATLQGSSSCDAGPMGTWVNLGSNWPEWRISVTGQWGATRSCAFTLEIRNASTGAVLDSAIIVLVAVAT